MASTYDLTPGQVQGLSEKGSLPASPAIAGIVDRRAPSWQPLSMTHPNIRAYEAAVKALGDDDLTLFLSSVSEDVHWWELGSTRPVVGRSDLEQHLLQKRHERVVSEVHDVLANDEHLVALVHAKTVVRSAVVDISYAEVFHFNDIGLVTKRQVFPSNVWTALELLTGEEPAP